MHKLFWAIFLFAFSVTIVSAESISISLRVGDTSFTATGFTSPGAQVTIMQNNVVLGTTVADSLGNFSKSVQVDNPGIQSFDIFALDNLGHTSDTVTLTLNIIGNAETEYQNLFLPPTAYLTSANPLASGQNIVLAGATYPTSTLSALLTGGIIATTSAELDGTWTIHIPTSGLSAGTYQVTVTSTNGAYVSASTLPLSFTILASPSSPTPTPSPGASQEETTTTIFTPLLTLLRPDSTPSQPLPSVLPSFLTAYLRPGTTKLLKEHLPDILWIWVQAWRAFSKETVVQALDHSSVIKVQAPHTCDLNRDQTCNLTDFSILLYYINR